VSVNLDLPTYVYKIMFRLVATDMSHYFSLQSTNDYSAITRRGNPYKLVKCKSLSYHVRKNFSLACHQVLLFLNHYNHLEIHSIILICVYIRCTKRFYCVVAYLVLLNRPRYFMSYFLLLCFIIID